MLGMYVCVNRIFFFGKYLQNIFFVYCLVNKIFPEYFSSLHKILYLFKNMMWAFLPFIQWILIWKPLKCFIFLDSIIRYFFVFFLSKVCKQNQGKKVFFSWYVFPLLTQGIYFLTVFFFFCYQNFTM